MEDPISQDYTEKRQSFRFIERNKYSLVLDGKLHQGNLGNISLGGAYLRTISPLITKKNLYQDCQIIIHLPETIVSLSCTVAFVGIGHNEETMGVGIAFGLDEERALASIADYIKNTL